MFPFRHIELYKPRPERGEFFSRELSNDCLVLLLVFGLCAALAEFERELIRERTLTGLTAARPHRRQDVRAVESLGGGWPRPR